MAIPAVQASISVISGPTPDSAESRHVIFDFQANQHQQQEEDDSSKEAIATAEETGNHTAPLEHLVQSLTRLRIETIEVFKDIVAKHGKSGKNEKEEEGTKLPSRRKHDVEEDDEDGADGDDDNDGNGNDEDEDEDASMTEGSEQDSGNSTPHQIAVSKSTGDITRTSPSPPSKKFRL